jgi:hypothetical protein
VFAKLFVWPTEACVRAIDRRRVRVLDKTVSSDS